MKRLRLCLTLGLTLLTVLPTGQSMAQTAEALFERLKAKYDATESIRAAFTESVSVFDDDTQVFTGLLILKGEKYRVETEAQTVVTDGIVTYVYLPEDNQVLINDYIEDEASFSPPEFLQNYDQDYEVQSMEVIDLDGERHFKLLLAPKTPDSFFQETILWMRDRDDLITRLEVLDMNETRMIFELTDIQLNVDLDDTTFTLTPPEGAEVIDLRS